MKRKIVEISKKEQHVAQEKKISRKEAIKKSGLIALSAATMLMLINSPSQAKSSPASPPAESPSSGGGPGPWK